VLVQDQLFATLDPTTRRVVLPSGKEALFTDTVGFIQKLPTELVAAFRATLEEVTEADVLLHIADVSDRGLLSKVGAVEHVLDDLGAGDKPTILALNKVDLVDPDTDMEGAGDARFAMRRALLDELHDRYEHVVPISAEQGVGMAELLATIEEGLYEQMIDADLVLPYGAGEALNLWHRQGIVEEQIYTDSGVRVRGRVPRWLLGALQEEPSDE